MTRPCFLALIPALLAAAPVQAPPTETVDEMLARAQRLSREKRREEAREVCRQALLRSPGYHDIRILRARLFTWDGRYDEGRAELRTVLAQAPDHLDARKALIDLEAWSDHPRAALAACDEGLALRPQEPILHYRRGRILKSLNDLPGALEAAKRALALDPNLHAARQLRDDLVELNQRSKAGLAYAYDHFDRTFDPWRTASLTLSHRFDAGTVIGRFNHATRFGTSGDQVEVDAYPRIVEGTYAYLNVGHSDDSIFPKLRWGAELYHNFPRGLEGSLGLRHLQFNASTVDIYTGSLGKYWGDWLFTFRANVTPSSLGASKSGSLSVRRYFGDPDAYLAFSVGTGVSPDQSNPDAAILDLKSKKASLGGQALLARRFILSAGVAWERQELLSGEARTQLTLSAGIDCKF